MNTKNPLQSKVATMSTDQILRSLKMIGGGFVTVEARMVRAALFEEFETREGGEALDALFELMGM